MNTVSFVCIIFGTQFKICFFAFQVGDKPLAERQWDRSLKFNPLSSWNCRWNLLFFLGLEYVLKLFLNKVLGILHLANDVLEVSFIWAISSTISALRLVEVWNPDIWSLIEDVWASILNFRLIACHVARYSIIQTLDLVLFCLFINCLEFKKARRKLSVMRGWYFLEFVKTGRLSAWDRFTFANLLWIRSRGWF